MYFYNLEGTAIVKYKVKLDTDKLNKLKKQIINNCSIIEHKTYETSDPIIKFESPYMKNYKSQKVEENGNYIVSYDLYNYPYLVKLINELLLENTSVITEIQNYQEIFSVDEPRIAKKYNRLLKLLEREDIKIVGVVETKEEKEERIKNLKELESLLNDYQKEKEIYTKTHNIEMYKNKVLECIKLKKIKSISLDIYLEMQNFFNDSNENNLHNSLKRIVL